MKAAVLNTLDGTFQIETIEIGEPRGREVLVEVKASGLCHSDLHAAERNLGIELPAVLGHEVAGVVTAIGPQVTEIAIGDHVVASVIQSCGHCRQCRAGNSCLCEKPGEMLRADVEEPRLTRGEEPVTQAFGTGGFAEYTLVHENQLAKVPKELPFPQACLLGCSTITGAGAVINCAGIRPGETVAIIGIGGVGLNGISGAKLAGAGRIVAIDMQPLKEALARKFGATDFIDASQGDPVKALKQLVPGGVDHAFDMVGGIIPTQQAIRMVTRGGTAYLIGLPDPEKSMDGKVITGLFVNQTTVKAVYMGSSDIKHDIPMFADLYLQGRFNLDDLISREINISEINEAYAELKSGAIARSVITSF